MGKISVNRVTNAAIWINGNSYIGQVEEITLPVIKPVMSEHKSLGLNYKIELPAGIDKLEGKIKFNSKYPKIEELFADFYTSLQLQVRFNIETYNGTQKVNSKGVVQLIIQSKGISGGAFKQMDNVEAESDFNVLYIKQTLDGVDSYEVDVLNNVYKVRGVDLLKDSAAALGG